MSKDTVLIVDDEPNVLKALGRLLRHNRYEILTATNGKEALELNRWRRRQSRHRPASACPAA